MSTRPELIRALVLFSSSERVTSSDRGSGIELILSFQWKHILEELALTRYEILQGGYRMYRNKKRISL